MTTTWPDIYLYGVDGESSGGTGVTHTLGNGFTLLDEQTNGSSVYTGYSAYRIVSSTGTYNTTMTTGGTITSARIALLALQEQCTPPVAWLTA